MPRQTGVFGHNCRRLVRANEENIQWKRRTRCGRNEFAFCSGKVECPVRLVDKHGPARGPDDPGNGHTCAMRFEFITALAVTLGINGTATVELRASFSKRQ